MTTINSRIKKVRKNAGLNQKEFSESLGVTQSGVSYMEQDGRNVSDMTIKGICNRFGVNEHWLRDGVEPIYVQPKSFSLDDFVHSHNADDLELEVIKAYFELDSDIRHKVVDHFKSYLLRSTTNPLDDVPSTPEELEEKFPPVDIADKETG